MAELAPSLNEATLRQEFMTLFRNWLKAETDYDPMPRLEEGVALPMAGATSFRGRRGERGRTDARIGTLIFEIKIPSVEIRVAIEQCQRYVRAHGTEGTRVRGIAYNGTDIAFIDEAGNEIRREKAREGAGLLAAWGALLAYDLTDPKHLALSLKLESEVVKAFVSDLYSAFEKHHKKIGFVGEAFEVWHGVYGVGANLNKEAIEAIEDRARRLSPPVPLKGRDQAYLFVFILETYLAVLLRLLVARLAVLRGLSQSATVEDLLSPAGSRPTTRLREMGTLLPSLGSVFEEDPFLWLCDVADADAKYASRFDDHITRIACVIDDVEISGLAFDFLRGLYHEFFDRPMRHALGEFYTTEELANEVLDSGAFDGTLSAPLADITCGSGTFLVLAIRRVVEREKKRHRSNAEILKHIIQNIVGVDVQPFAVAMSRVNYLLALGDLLTNETLRLIHPMRVPVYWADSLARLSKYDKEPIDPESSLIEEVFLPGLGKFRMPNHKELDWDNIFKALREALSVKGNTTEQVVWDKLSQQLREQDVLRFQKTLKALVKMWVDRHNKGRDSRWLPMLRNVLSVEQLKGRCQYIVGNPPWVRIHDLEENLRDRVYADYSLCAEAGWKRGAKLGNMGIGFAKQTDFSVAFVERALELLAPNGILAFVITSKIQQALYANALRKHLIESTRILRLIDYSLSEKPLFEDATNYPLVFAVQKAQSEADVLQNTVPVTMFNIARHRRDYSVAQADLPLFKDDLESPWMLAPPEARKGFRRMQAASSELGMMISSPQMGVKTSRNRVYLSDKMETTDEEGVILATFQNKEQARIERQMLLPILRGEDVKPWTYTPKSFILWTHHANDGAPLSRLPKLTAEYLRKHKVELENRDDLKKSDSGTWWRIFRVAPEKLRSKVIWQRISDRMGAAFIPQLIVPMDTTRLIPCRNKSDGLLLSAFLNSTPLRAFAASFADRLQGSYFEFHSWVVACLPLPGVIVSHIKEGRTNKTVSRILEISKALHDDPEHPELDDLESELARLVASLYGLSLEDLAAIYAYWSFIRPERIRPAPTVGRAPYPDEG